MEELNFLHCLETYPEQHALKDETYCLNTNIYSYLETSGGKSGKSYNLYLNVHFFNVSFN